jgi:hypothetical protein
MPTASSATSHGDDISTTATGATDDYTYYVPAHSDYLIHWTGKDIDSQHDANWHTDHSSTTDDNVTTRYLDRLKGILRHGLWMMDDNEAITMAGRTYPRPRHFRTCFSELKLSIVRGHARRYGRLGIGFKRFFLFNRLGCPMTYYHSSRANWFTPSLWSSQPSSYDEFWSCFLKPMTEITPDTTMRYSFYDESEWRIIYSDAIATRLASRGKADILKAFIPKACFGSEMNQLAASSPVQPGAVIPVRDPWFAMIIYPSLAVKVAAESDAEIRNFIASIKPFRSLPASFAKRNPAWLEHHNRPIELDLDACRHF